MKILICEDNKLALKTLSVILEREKFQVDSAEDGNVAMELIKNSAYDLIVVDLHLPFHSGLELIKYTRSDLKLKTPVLVVTAFSDILMKKMAVESGIDGYILKPFNPADIVKTINTILNK